MTELPRLMFAAPGSGSGKTTVTCAFLGAMVRRGLDPAAFKCGPDYIDPMFHTRVIGVPGRNLDLFFGDAALARGLLCRHAAGHPLAVLEGVMGYYDGIGEGSGASSWQLADATETPVVLVVNPKGMSRSLAALVKGFLALETPHRIAGLLLNPCSASLYSFLRPMLERETGLRVYGYLPELPDCRFESRHLGLVTAAEIADLQQRVDRLAHRLAQTADLDALLALARTAPPLTGSLPDVRPVTDTQPVVAVARDDAFCFYYADNLDLLRQLGARVVPFSPLRDAALPAGTCALYLGGGYPELHAKALSDNAPMLRAVRAAVNGGLPTLAECGGFQYLQRTLTAPDGTAYPMVGVLRSDSAPTGRLGRFGYLTLTAQRDTLLCNAGDAIRAHEFHYWDSSDTGDACVAQKPSGSRSWRCVVATKSLFAGYPHLYFYSNPSFAASFVEAAGRYRHEMG